MSVLVNLHPLDHGLCSALIQLIVLVLHNQFTRRILLLRVTKTPSTDAPTVVLVVFNTSIPTGIHQP